MSNESQMSVLKERLFGENGLRPRDIKITPGLNRYATSEEIAGEMNKALDNLENGEYEVIAVIGE